MPETLEEAKDRLQRSFLGKAGIHALGLSRARQAIRVYVSPDAQPGRTALLEQLRKAAEPFPVIVVVEERPRVS